MKKLLLLLPLLFLPVQVQAQQVNNFGVCTQYQEVYQPGYYDSYGNYVQGGVYTQSYNVPCPGGTAYAPAPQYYQQRTCNPIAGAALGAGLAEAISGGNGWKYSSSWFNGRNSGSYNESYRNRSSNGWSLFGAGLGAIMFGC